MGIGRGSGRALATWSLEISAKKAVFLVSSIKSKFHHFWPPLREIYEKSPSDPPVNNPSNALG